MKLPLIFLCFAHAYKSATKKRLRNFYFFEKAWQQTFSSELSIKWRLADTSSPCPTKRLEAIRCYSAKEKGYPDSFLKRLAYAGLEVYMLSTCCLAMRTHFAGTEMNLKTNALTRLAAFSPNCSKAFEMSSAHEPPQILVHMSERKILQ